jgi:cysteine desulfurase
LENVQGSKVNGSKRTEERLPSIVNLSFLGVEGESLVITLDEEGIAVSTGSACTSTALMPSHVLIAMGLPELDAQSSLRISMGRYTTIKEIDQFIKVLPKIVERLRRISGR